GIAISARGTATISSGSMPLAFLTKRDKSQSKTPRQQKALRFFLWYNTRSPRSCLPSGAAPMLRRKRLRSQSFHGGRRCAFSVRQRHPGSAEDTSECASGAYSGPPHQIHG